MSVVMLLEPLDNYFSGEGVFVWFIQLPVRLLADLMCDAICQALFNYFEQAKSCVLLPPMH